MERERFFCFIDREACNINVDTITSHKDISYVGGTKWNFYDYYYSLGTRQSARIPSCITFKKVSQHAFYPFEHDEISIEISCIKCDKYLGKCSLEHIRGGLFELQLHCELKHGIKTYF